MKYIEQYLDAIERLTGQSAAEFFQIKAAPGGVYVAHFKNVPTQGYSTAFSCGLSTRHHRNWVYAKPELLISVNSLDDSWGLAMGDIIVRSSPDWTFSYGTIVRFGEQISSESEMTDFGIYKNCLYSETASLLQLESERIHLTQLYPIYANEHATIRKKGFEGFFSGDLRTFCNVHRNPIPPGD